MGFTDAIRSGFSNYIVIQGRAQRSAYWFWVLFTILGSILASIVDGMISGVSFAGTGAVESLFSLATILPSITVAIRRLHDLGRTGWWLLIVFVPIVGWIVLIVFFVSKGTDGDNDHGPDPLEAQAAD